MSVRIIAESVTPRSTSRGRADDARGEFLRAIEGLTKTITEAVARLEAEIGTIRTRLDSMNTAITEERRLRTGAIDALRAELQDTNRIAREALQTARAALEFAEHHHHRYNPSTGYDWHTSKAYPVPVSLDRWYIKRC